MPGRSVTTSLKSSGAREDGQHAELRRLRVELKRVTEERDILKEAARVFAKECG